MSVVVIITGPPGAGKTTVARLLAQARTRGMHIPCDVFYEFAAHPIPPYRPESHEQNAAIIRAAVRAAASLVADGYDVFLEGIFGPWFLSAISSELSSAGIQLDYVVLQLSVDEALARVRQRSGQNQDTMVETMHSAFQHAPSLCGHTIQTSLKHPEEVVAEIERKLRAGVLRMDLARLQHAD